MDAEQINRRIHEFLGRGCYHDWLRNHKVVTENENICVLCGQHHNNSYGFSWWHIAFELPDYTTDLNAVREAELKCIEEDGAFKYANVLSKRFREGFPNQARALMGDEQIMTLIVTASALTRAQAVCDVLEKGK